MVSHEVLESTIDCMEHTCFEYYKDFQIGMGTMKSFIFSILNNYKTSI